MRSEAYPEMASVLQRFVAGIESVLGSNFLGAYLVGSLATGDFDLDSESFGRGWATLEEAERVMHERRPSEITSGLARIRE